MENVLQSIAELTTTVNNLTKRPEELTSQLENKNKTQPPDGEKLKLHEDIKARRRKGNQKQEDATQMTNNPRTTTKWMPDQTQPNLQKVNHTGRSRRWVHRSRFKREKENTHTLRNIFLQGKSTTEMGEPQRMESK